MQDYGTMTHADHKIYLFFVMSEVVAGNVKCTSLLLCCQNISFSFTQVNLM